MNGNHVEERIRRKMDSRGVDSVAIQGFVRMVNRVRNEHLGYVPLEEVAAPHTEGILEKPADPDQLAEIEERGEALLSKVAVVKLNGGRSTTMDGRIPKGLLEAKDGYSYLEIIIQQMMALRDRRSVDIPLVLMNSFFTHEPTLEVVRRFDLPVLTFIQNQVPRLVEETLEPLDTGTDEDWVPPGHGDVYVSLQRTGLLDRLRRDGIRWAFISNLDNLAACVEPWILGLIEHEGIEFLLEVTDRTRADRKGGTLVVRNHNLDLLEIAMVAPHERDAFMDIERFRVFNTNNVWIDLDALADALDRDSLNLPIIQNHKRVFRQKVIQLETAMGAAVGSFPRARGLRVGRERFFPTKRVADLFVVQSDACILDPMFRLRRNPFRSPDLPFMPRVVFSEGFLESPLRMAERFEKSTTVSLVDAWSLEVSGAVFFERDVKIMGKVKVEARDGQESRIERGAVLKDGTYPQMNCTEDEVKG